MHQTVQEDHTEYFIEIKRVNLDLSLLCYTVSVYVVGILTM